MTAGIGASAKDPAAARAFVEFLMTAEATAASRQGIRAPRSGCKQRDLVLVRERPCERGREFPAHRVDTSSLRDRFRGWKARAKLLDLVGALQGPSYGRRLLRGFSQLLGASVMAASNDRQD